MWFTCGWVSAHSTEGNFASTLDAAIRNDEMPATPVTIRHVGKGYGLFGAGNNIDSAENEEFVVLLAGRPSQGQGYQQIPAAGLLDGYLQSGAEFLKQLQGSFQCVVIDRRNHRALLATDRFGTVPLYYQHVADCLVFSSRLSLIKSLSVEPLQIDPQALYNYVFFHCIPSPRTIYRGVAKLGPASTLSLTSTGTDVLTYWKPEFQATQISKQAVDDAAEEVRRGMRAPSRTRP